jgi:heme/copper-type cytochrome/quinol oxidase subunit 2
LDRVSGLPAHPLIVHGAVVLVPLLVLGAILYAVLPMLRGHLRWPVGLLGIVAPLAIVAARISGENFKQNKNVQSPQMQALIRVHEGYGNKAMWYTIALGVVVLVFVFLIVPRASAGSTSGGTAVATRPVALQIALAVVAVVVAVVVAYYVYKVGDSGAHMAWGGY